MRKTLRQFSDRICEVAYGWVERIPKISIHDLSRPEDVDKEEVETYIALASYAEKQIIGLEKAYNMPHSCTKGCAHCCYQAVQVIETETRIILNWLRLNNIQLDPDLSIRLKKWKDAFDSTGLSLSESKTDEFRTKYFYAHIPCLFLQPDNTCAIYPVRPRACRHYFSMGDPKKCEQSPFVDEALTLFCWDYAIQMKLYMSYETTQSSVTEARRMYQKQLKQREGLLPALLIEDLKNTNV